MVERASVRQLVFVTGLEIYVELVPFDAPWSTCDLQIRFIMIVYRLNEHTLCS